MNKKDIIIVIPVHKETLSDIEKASLTQCLKILNEYPICIIGPKSLNLSKYEIVFNNCNKEFLFEKFADSNFSDYQSYNYFCLSQIFYERFSHYKYMLIYQLDAWVFRDELLYWCNQNYDYLGAPWDYEELRRYGLKLQEGGNGGFSLRKISSMIELTKNHLEILSASSHKSIKDIYYIKGKRRLISNILNFPIILFFYIFQYFIKWQDVKNEDVIIAKYAKKFLPSFKFANQVESARFSIETYPRYFYDLIGSNLPFGCHDFKRHDFEFWEQFIEVNEEEI